MRKAILFITFLISLTAVAAQKARKDSAGNYHAVDTLKIQFFATGKTYTDEFGMNHPIFRDNKGRLVYFTGQRKFIIKPQ
jgi:hypothetical protein